MQPGLLGQLCKSHPPETPPAVRREDWSPQTIIFYLCECQSMEDTNALLEMMIETFSAKSLTWLNLV